MGTQGRLQKVIRSPNTEAKKAGVCRVPDVLLTVDLETLAFQSVHFRVDERRTTRTKAEDSLQTNICAFLATIFSKAFRDRDGKQMRQTQNHERRSTRMQFKQQGPLLEFWL